MPRGTHNVKAYVQGFIVDRMSFYPDPIGLRNIAVETKSGDGDLNFQFLRNWEEREYDYWLSVYMKPGEQQPKDKFEAKRFFVGVTTPDCKDPSYKNLEIRIRAISASRNADARRNKDNKL